jgi:hypothetical protein
LFKSKKLGIIKQISNNSTLNLSQPLYNMLKLSSILVVCLIGLVTTFPCETLAFSPFQKTVGRRTINSSGRRPQPGTSQPAFHTPITLGAIDNENEDYPMLAESDQTVVGVVGTLAGLITLYSEWTLKSTGCGLPAGPFGLVGLFEGLSYLGVTGLAAYSIVTKVKTVSSFVTLQTLTTNNVSCDLTNFNVFLFHSFREVDFHQDHSVY